MKKLLHKLMQLAGLKSKELAANATDAEGYPIGRFSRLLNNNDPIFYSTPKMKLQGIYIRANPDGSEDLMKLIPDGYSFVETICGPGKGKFDYLITKASKQGKYQYLEDEKVKAKYLEAKRASEEA